MPFVPATVAKFADCGIWPMDDPATRPALPQLGADRGELRKRLFLLPVADGDCLPDTLLPVTCPGAPDDIPPESPHDGLER